MKQVINQIQVDSEQQIETAKNMADLEQVRIDLLGKKGALTDLLKNLKSVSEQERPMMGKLANELKGRLLQQIQDKKIALSQNQLEQEIDNDDRDVSLPSQRVKQGHQHPISQVQNEIVDILAGLGFEVKEGPEIENEDHNFNALNIPDDHPARDMHDTFYLDATHLLRTHTSPVQIRTMKSQAPPIRILAPGKVYRCDADVSHSPVFHQIEGLYVDKDVNFAQLKGTLSFFLRALFGDDREIRFRPSYFPFTEPSVEVDVAFEVVKDGKTQKQWMEILGAGMVNRNVFRYVGYDPDQVSGFAFGVGVERIAMLKYQIPDIRLFYENDQRFIRQF
ncbi:MAG: phenylalanine--tRNA ligase subunit alpha [Actinobacteria bacterium]|nr:phenylalanine--tRNA ligase subunit alpha [Actinomycetota bacterium]